MEETIFGAGGALEIIQTALDEANLQGIRVCLSNPRSHCPC